MTIVRSVIAATLLGSLVTGTTWAQTSTADEAYEMPTSPPAFESAEGVLFAGQPCPDCPPCPACGRCGSRCGCCGPWGLPHPDCFTACGIKYGGWVDVGASVVSNMPDDRFNGVVTFNDRDGELQMNQFWLYLERAVDPHSGSAIGGRIDMVYGTDARFTQAADGLEADWDQTERFYQLALPQMYLDVGLGGTIVRMGHFYTILGYEVVQAPENFFYSHAYTMQYGEPFTHTGMLLIHNVGPFCLTAGFDRGADNFDDNDDGLDDLGFLGGIAWTSYAQDMSAAFAINAGEEGPGVSQTIYSLVGTLKLGCRLTYVIQHDYGQRYNQNLGQDFLFDPLAEWYGINQYLFYEINPCWSVGARVEWFQDEDGTRVTGLGQGNQSTGSFPGHFYNVTLGLNWTPCPNIIVRPELRYDWYDATAPTTSLPFDAGGDDEQFMGAVDAIVTF